MESLYLTNFKASIGWQLSTLRQWKLDSYIANQVNCGLKELCPYFVDLGEGEFLGIPDEMIKSNWML